MVLGSRSAYLIGEIIVIPLTDFLSRVFSFRRYLITNTVLFLMFSTSCSFAHSLGQMIVARACRDSPAACSFRCPSRWC